MKLALLAFTISCSLLAQDPFQARVTGKGQAMILIPGLSSGGETWDTTVDHYRDRCECHVLTVAGFAGVPLGAWQSYAQYTDHKRTEANLRNQYFRLRGVKIVINDTSRHFIMWDDPQWMFGQMDGFLEAL